MNTNTYLQVTISAESKEQADFILNSLLKKKLITGGQIIAAPARFLWKGEVTDMEYFTIYSFTVSKNKKAIISDVKKNSIEEVPMISFVELDGNKELLDWIDKTLN